MVDEHGGQHGHDDARSGAVDADGGAGLDAATSLALLERQRAEVHRRVGVNPASLCLVWGLAWLVGFGTTWFTFVVDGMPSWLGAVVPAVLIVAGVAVSLRQMVRTGRGVRGRSRRVGAMYGWSWLLGFACLNAVNLRVVGHGLSAEGAALLWSGSALALVGVLYLAGGAIWNDLGQFGMGAWMLVCAAGAVFAGVPGNFAVLTLAGGGGFLAMAGYLSHFRGLGRPRVDRGERA